EAYRRRGSSSCGHQLRRRPRHWLRLCERRREDVHRAGGILRGRGHREPGQGCLGGPRSCGRCDLTGFGLSGRPFVGTAACADLPAYAPPHFKEAGGTVLDCSDLKDHCKNGEHTDYVSKKCPATCGICKELELNKKVDAEMAAAMAAKVTTITITTTTTTPMREIEFNLKDATERGTNTDGNATNNETATASSGQWCSRRRRWGYCYSRRRRLD
ncbi:unnamed protein product, partial [Prorocentrum cordatum]